jgi:hypothetical protein
MGDGNYNQNNNSIYLQNYNFENMSISEVKEKEAKILRFAIDYCRASPNITLKNKNQMNIGWRNNKFHFDVDLEISNNFNFKSENVI